MSKVVPELRDAAIRSRLTLALGQSGALAVDAAMADVRKGLDNRLREQFRGEVFLGRDGVLWAKDYVGAELGEGKIAQVLEAFDNLVAGIRSNRKSYEDAFSEPLDCEETGRQMAGALRLLPEDVRRRLDVSVVVNEFSDEDSHVILTGGEEYMIIGYRNPDTSNVGWRVEEIRNFPGSAVEPPWSDVFPIGGAGNLLDALLQVHARIVDNLIQCRVESLMDEAEDASESGGVKI